MTLRHETVFTGLTQDVTDVVLSWDLKSCLKFLFFKDTKTLRTLRTHDVRPFPIVYRVHVSVVRPYLLLRSLYF